MSVMASAICQPVALGDWQNLLAVIWDFLSLSLFSLGGGNTLLTEYHYLAVDKYCWLSSQQFAEIYAIAEGAPGPSSMIVGLLGMGAAYREGPLWGVLSGVMAELAILLPSTLVMVAAALSWNRFKDSPVRLAFEPARRGWSPVPAVVVETRYPFGLMRAWSVWRPAAQVLAAPRPEQPAPPLPTGAAEGGKGALRD